MSEQTSTAAEEVRIPLIGKKAPSFKALTTQGGRSPSPTTIMANG